MSGITMNDVNPSTILCLREGLVVVPFDTNARKQEYMAVLPDGRYYHLTPRLKQLVECIDGQRTLDQIATLLNQKWQHSVHPKQVWEATQRYLAPNGLLKGPGDSLGANQPESVFSWHTKLLSPRHTRPVVQVGQYLFTRPIVVLSLVGILLVHLAMYTQFDKGMVKFAQALGNGDFLAVYGLVMISVLVHEFGHASACHRFGEDYGDIGLGLYFVFPVFYADVTRVWKLSRWQRIVVDLGGIYFQLLAGACYYLLYRVSGARFWLLAAVQIDILVLLSFNPVAKFDGYWVMSDLLGVPNLHRRLTQMLQGLLKRSRTEGVPIEPVAQVWLWVYMLAFPAVIIPLFILNLVRTPEIAQQFVTGLGSNLHAVGLGWQVRDATMIGAALVRLVSPLATILGILLLLWQIVRGRVRVKSVSSTTEQSGFLDCS
jgi:putative peptide zinc metalloprotease protein